MARYDENVISFLFTNNKNLRAMIATLNAMQVKFQYDYEKNCMGYFCNVNKQTYDQIIPFLTSEPPLMAFPILDDGKKTPLTRDLMDNIKANSIARFSGRFNYNMYARFLTTDKRNDETLMAYLKNYNVGFKRKKSVVALQIGFSTSTVGDLNVSVFAQRAMQRQGQENIPDVEDMELSSDQVIRLIHNTYVTSINRSLEHYAPPFFTVPGMNRSVPDQKILSKGKQGKIGSAIGSLFGRS